MLFRAIQDAVIVVHPALPGHVCHRKRRVLGLNPLISLAGGSGALYRPVRNRPCVQFCEMEKICAQAGVFYWSSSYLIAVDGEPPAAIFCRSP